MREEQGLPRRGLRDPDCIAERLTHSLTHVVSQHFTDGVANHLAYCITHSTTDCVTQRRTDYNAKCSADTAAVLSGGMLGV